MDPQITGKNQQDVLNGVLTGQVPVRPRPKPQPDEEIEEEAEDD